ncbi:hypothetical protein SLS53_001218 [Cytospora paraplurivora]|uniref:Myb-like domain-containing protein n=1 Tax=Cytospora paraplurivora TaxID=2898453 RepID=A0AAN9YKX0_9PEZI
MSDRNKDEAHPATAFALPKDVKTDVDVKTEIEVDDSTTTIDSGPTDNGKTDNNMADNGKIDDSKAELGPKTPKRNKDRSLSFELNAVESLLFFNIIRFNPCHEQVDWEKVAHASGLKNVNTARVRFRQVIKKYKLEDVAPATPRQIALKRKAADGDDHGEGDDGAPFSESKVPGAPRARPSRSGGRRKRNKKEQEPHKSQPQESQPQESQTQVPQPQAQVSAPQAQLQNPQPQPMVAQYQPPHVQAQVPLFQFQTPQSQPLVVQHQPSQVQTQDPQAQFVQVPQLALEDYMANHTGGLAGQNNMDNDDDETWMEFLDREYLGI